MNIELNEVVALDVSDDDLELAAGGAQWICSFAICSYTVTLLN